MNPRPPLFRRETVIPPLSVQIVVTIRGESWKPQLSDPEVLQYLLEEVGEDGLEMARFLESHPHISGVDLQDAFKDRKASTIRKVLYRMMEAHAAEYAKDTDSKGWETFYWDLDLREVGLILRRRWAAELLALRKQIKFEEDHQFYACTAASSSRTPWTWSSAAPSARPPWIRSVTARP